jgi:hypothetical protein
LRSFEFPCGTCTIKAAYDEAEARFYAQVWTERFGCVVQVGRSTQLATPQAVNIALAAEMGRTLFLEPLALEEQGILAAALWAVEHGEEPWKSPQPEPAPEVYRVPFGARFAIERDGHRIEAGYDRPLRNYYAQVWTGRGPVIGLGIFPVIKYPQELKAALAEAMATEGFPPLTAGEAAEFARLLSCSAGLG